MDNKIKLYFYKNPEGEYYLTKVFAPDGVEDLVLPRQIKVDSSYYSYGIYKYAFWGNKDLRKLTIPSTIYAINNEAFAGSFIENIILHHNKPPKIINFAQTFVSKAEKVIISCPKFTYGLYRANGWVDDYLSNVQLVESNIAFESEIDIPILSHAGETFKCIVLSEDTETIGEMSYLNIVDESGSGPLFVFGAPDIQNNDKNNQETYKVYKQDSIYEEIDNVTTLIKASEALRDISDFDILGPNSLQNNTAENFTFNGKRIESLAFQNCINLQTLIIHKNIEYIAPDAFLNCPNLSTIYFKNEKDEILTKSENDYFSWVDGKIIYAKQNNKQFPLFIAKNFDFAQSTHTQSLIQECFDHFQDGIIPSRFFEHVIYKGELFIPFNIIEIGRSAFANSKIDKLNFTSQSAADDIQNLIIGANAFGNIQDLKQIVFFDNIEGHDERDISIKEYAFADCNKLTYIYLSKNIQEIEKHAFSDKVLYLISAEEIKENWNIDSDKCLRDNEVENFISLSDKDSVYAYLKNQTVFIIGKGQCYDDFSDTSLDKIKAWNQLKEKCNHVFIAKEITSLGKAQFMNWTEIIKVEFEINSIIFQREFKGIENWQDLLIKANDLSNKEVQEFKQIVINSFNKLAENCFSGCAKLQSCILPPMVSEIPKYCFSGCTSLGPVFGSINYYVDNGTDDSYTEENFKGFYYYARMAESTYFWGNNNFGLTTINENAFINCNFKTIILDYPIKNIYSQAFYNNNNLVAIYYLKYQSLESVFNNFYGDNIFNVDSQKIKTLEDCSVYFLKAKPNAEGFYQFNIDDNSYVDLTKNLFYKNNRITDVFIGMSNSYKKQLIDNIYNTIVYTAKNAINENNNTIINLILYHLTANALNLTTGIKDQLSTAFEADEDVGSRYESRYILGQTSFQECGKLKKLYLSSNIIQPNDTNKTFYNCISLKDIYYNSELSPFYIDQQDPIRQQRLWFGYSEDKEKEVILNSKTTLHLCHIIKSNERNYTILPYTFSNAERRSIITDVVCEWEKTTPITWCDLEAYSFYGNNRLISFDFTQIHFIGDCCFEFCGFTNLQLSYDLFIDNLLLGESYYDYRRHGMNIFANNNNLTTLEFTDITFTKNEGIIKEGAKYHNLVIPQGLCQNCKHLSVIKWASPKNYSDSLFAIAEIQQRAFYNCSQLSGILDLTKNNFNMPLTVGQECFNNTNYLIINLDANLIDNLGQTSLWVKNADEGCINIINNNNAQLNIDEAITNIKNINAKAFMVNTSDFFGEFNEDNNTLVIHTAREDLITSNTSGTNSDLSNVEILHIYDYIDSMFTQDYYKSNFANVKAIYFHFTNDEFTIPSYCFAGCRLLEEVSGPQTQVSCIEEYSFDNCPRLNILSFSDINTIKTNAFYQKTTDKIFVNELTLYLFNSMSSSVSWENGWNNWFKDRTVNTGKTKSNLIELNEHGYISSYWVGAEKKTIKQDDNVSVYFSGNQIIITFTKIDNTIGDIMSEIKDLWDIIKKEVVDLQINIQSLGYNNQYFAGPLYFYRSYFEGLNSLEKVSIQIRDNENNFGSLSYAFDIELFNNCQKLQKFYFGGLNGFPLYGANAQIYYGLNMFANCPNLQEIEICATGQQLQGISYNEYGQKATFELNEISLFNNNTAFDSKQFILKAPFNFVSQAVNEYIRSTITQLIINNNGSGQNEIITIPDNFLQQNTRIQRLIIPDSAVLIGIGNNAFENCTNLIEIIAIDVWGSPSLPSIKLYQIGDKAFYGCSNFIMPIWEYISTEYQNSLNGGSKIGNQAFKGMNIPHLDGNKMPASVLDTVGKDVWSNLITATNIPAVFISNKVLKGEYNNDLREMSIMLGPIDWSHLSSEFKNQFNSVINLQILPKDDNSEDKEENVTYANCGKDMMYNFVPHLQTLEITLYHQRWAFDLSRLDSLKYVSSCYLEDYSPNIRNIVINNDVNNISTHSEPYTCNFSGYEHLEFIHFGKKTEKIILSPIIDCPKLIAICLYAEQILLSIPPDNAGLINYSNNIVNYNTTPFIYSNHENQKEISEIIKNAVIGEKVPEHWYYIYQGGKKTEYPITSNSGYAIHVDDKTGLTYIEEKWNSNQLTVTKFTPVSTDIKVVSIPETFNGHQVTKIASGAFTENTPQIKKVTIPNSIKTIETHAFMNCTNIEEIEFIDFENLNCELQKQFFFAENSGEYKPNIIYRGKKDYFNHDWDLITNSGEYLYLNGYQAKNADQYLFPMEYDGSTQDLTIEVPNHLSYITLPNIIDYYQTNTSILNQTIQNVKIQFDRDDTNNLIESLIFDTTFKDCENNSQCFEGKYYCTTTKTIEFLRVNQLKIDLRFLMTKWAESTWPDIGIKAKKIIMFDSNPEAKDGDLNNSSSSNSPLQYIIGSVYKSAVQTIEFLNGIKFIPQYCCSYFEALSSVIIPNSVTKIGDNAFSYNGALLSIKLSDNLKIVGTQAFARSGLCNLTLPNSCLEIQDEAFIGCYYLANIQLNNQLQVIGKSAFEGCMYMVSLNFPSTLTSLGDRTLYECYYLQNITLPVNFENTLQFSNIYAPPPDSAYPIEINIIGNAETCPIVFNDITNLTRVEFSGKIKKLPYQAFAECTNLQEIILPTNLEEIGRSAFENCTNLAKLSLPKTLEIIGNSSFYNCTALTGISIPANVKSIGEFAFCYCKNLTSIDNLDTNQNLTIISGALFSECSALKKVKLPQNIETIGYSAFEQCTHLEEIQLNNKLNTIGNRAFAGCSILKEIEIPNSVTQIGEGCFASAAALQTITMPVAEGKTLGDYGIPSYITALQVLEINSNIKKLADNFANNYTSLEKIGLPNSLEEIGDYAFQQCTNLKNINLPNNLKTIGSYAFDGCAELNNIYMPDTVTLLGDYVFANCEKLQEIKISFNPGLITIPVGFCQNSKVNKVVMSSNIKTISAYAFKTTQLETIDNLYMVNTIGDEAFADNGQLKKLIIPNTTNNIGTGIVQGCSNLSNIIIPLCNNMNFSDVLFGGEELTGKNYANIAIKIIPSITTDNTITELNSGAALDYTRFISIDLSELFDISGITCKMPITLENIVLPPNLQEIGAMVFKNCAKLAGIDLPNSLKSIGSQAFYGCLKLDTIIIPKATFNIGNNALTAIGDTVILCLQKEALPGWHAEWADNKNIYYYSASKPLTTGYWRYVNDIPMLWFK